MNYYKTWNLESELTNSFDQVIEETETAVIVTGEDAAVTAAVTVKEEDDAMGVASAVEKEAAKE